MKNRQSGFGLLEVFISISIIVLGLLSVVILFENNFRYQRDNINKLISYNLAKEGIEIARWRRDTNLPSDRVWDCGLGGANNVEADVVLHEDDNGCGSSTGGWKFKKIGTGYDCTGCASRESNVYYDTVNRIYVQSDKNPGSGGFPANLTGTIFKRYLIIDKNDPLKIRVTSRVEYAADRAPVELSEDFYNWRQ